MQVIIEYKKTILAYLLPVLIIISSVVLSFTLLDKYPELSIGITYDLTLLSPLVYWLLIRKTSIPKITVVPFFIIGIVLSSFILPNQYHTHLNFIIMYILPLVELTVISLVIYTMSKLIKELKIQKQKEIDFVKVIQKSIQKFIEIPLVVKIFTTEISMFYYSFFSWNHKTTHSENQYTYHQESGAIALYGGFLVIIFAEAIGLHFLLMSWNELIAWVALGLSVYSGIQVFAHVRAMILRPIEFQEKKILIRYGLFGETEINYDQIEKIEGDVEFDEDKKGVEKLSMLEGVNITLYLKSIHTTEKLYGLTKTYTIIQFYVDDKSRFEEHIKKCIIVKEAL